MKIDLNFKSRYFTMQELIHSDTAEKLGINNNPDERAYFNLCNLSSFLDIIRTLWGGPIQVNSGYRCKELNKAVGGAAKSLHMKGMAADITVGSKAENQKLFELIVNNMKMLNFDQCINENNFSWVHISKKYQAESNRNQVLNLNK